MPSSVSVLYVHPTGAFGGASKSLLELLKGAPDSAIKAMAVLPPGRASHYLAASGVEVHHARGLSQFDNTEFGHYRGLRWAILLREIAFLIPTLLAFIKLRRHRGRIDIIHFNEITLAPALVIGRLLLGKPVVMHVRSVQRFDRSSWRTRVVQHLLAKWVDSVVAIDETVRRSLPRDLRVEVVYNGFTPPHGREQVAPLELPLHPQSLRVGFIGGLVPVKGIMDFLAAVRLCVGRGVNIDAIVAGENPRVLRGLKGFLLRRSGLTGDYRRLVDDYVSAEGLGERVHLIGHIEDVSIFYRSIDLLCFPSLVEATGRPVFEAGFYAVPSIVTLVDAPGDTFVDGVTGVCVRRRDPEAMASAFEKLCNDRARLRRMGEAAQNLSEARFRASQNAERLLRVYRETLSRAAHPTT